jgi:hypothetical protein
MILFSFKVGKSFLKYTNHPITIPREHNSRLIKDIYGDSGKRTIPVIITPPGGRILNGQIYYGIAGYGPFYQIKVLGAYPSDYFGNFKIGEFMAVSIERSGKKINVTIFSPQQLRKISSNTQLNK